MARRKTSLSKSNKSTKTQKSQQVVQIQEEATQEIVIDSFGQPKCDGYVCLIDCENHILSSTTDIKDSFSTVVVPFDYEIYIHLEASLPQALKDVEEMMLIYASNRLNLSACDFQSQKALIPDDNGIIPSIASYPGDEVDQDNGKLLGKKLLVSYTKPIPKHRYESYSHLYFCVVPSFFF